MHDSLILFQRLPLGYQIVWRSQPDIWQLMIAQTHLNTSNVSTNWLTDTKAQAKMWLLQLYYPLFDIKALWECCELDSGLFLALRSSVGELGFCWHTLLWHRHCASLLYCHLIQATAENIGGWDASFAHAAGQSPRPKEAIFFATEGWILHFFHWSGFCQNVLLIISRNFKLTEHSLTSVTKKL